GQVAGGEARGPVAELDLAAGDPAEDELRYDGVRADDDEHGRRLAPSCEGRLVVRVLGRVAAVEAAHRSIESLGRHPTLRAGVDVLRGAALRQRRLDVVPQVEVDDLLAGGVVIDRDTLDLDD